MGPKRAKMSTAIAVNGSSERVRARTLKIRDYDVRYAMSILTRPVLPHIHSTSHHRTLAARNTLSGGRCLRLGIPPSPLSSLFLSRLPLCHNISISLRFVLAARPCVHLYRAVKRLSFRLVTQLESEKGAREREGLSLSLPIK